MSAGPWLGTRDPEPLTLRLDLLASNLARRSRSQTSGRLASGQDGYRFDRVNRSPPPSGRMPGRSGWHSPRPDRPRPVSRRANPPHRCSQGPTFAHPGHARLRESRGDQRGALPSTRLTPRTLESRIVPGLLPRRRSARPRRPDRRLQLPGRLEHRLAGWRTGGAAGRGSIPGHRTKPA